MFYVPARVGLAILGAVIAAALGWVILRTIGLRPVVVLPLVFWLGAANALAGWLLRPRSHHPVIECVLFCPGSWLYALVVAVWWFDPARDDFMRFPALFGLVVSWLATFAGYCVWKAHRKPAEDVCRVCEYNLAGNVSGRCPECGTPIEGARTAASGGPRFEEKT
jgi:hypothetical protein